MGPISLLLLACLVHGASSALCHSCFDSEILPLKSEIREVSFRHLSKLPSCTTPETKHCFVGCYELKVEHPDTKTVFLRTCATDSVIEKMRPGGNNVLAERTSGNSTISAYMCTLDTCNDKYGKEASLVNFSSWPVYFGALALVAVVCTGIAIAVNCRRHRNTQNFLYEGVSTN